MALPPPAPRGGRMEMEPENRPARAMGPSTLSAPMTRRHVVKILTGDLRIGLREGLVEEAIAAAFSAPLDEVKEANMLLGDLGQAAVLAFKGQLQSAELSLFRPIKSMLASPEPTAEAIWARFGGLAAAASSRSDMPVAGETPATTPTFLFVSAVNER